MKKAFLVLFIIIPVFAMASTQSQIQQADKLYDQFYYKASAALYQQVLENKPSVDVYLKLADAYFFDALYSPRTEQKGLLLKAKEAVEAAQKLSPNNAEILARFARIYGQLALFEGGKKKIKMAQQIKKYCEHALALNPNQSTAHAVLGVWHYELATLNPIEKAFANLFYGKIPKGDFNQSIDHLQKAVKADPNVIFFRLALAKSYLKVKNKKEANSHLEKALALPETVAVDRIYKEEIKQLLKKI